MKKITQLSFFMILLSLGSKVTLAQSDPDSSVHYQWFEVADTGHYCIPANVTFYGGVIPKGYNYSSPVTIKVNFNDGTDTTIETTVQNVYQFALKHTYSIAGKFLPKATFIFSDTTVEATSDFVQAYDNCGSVSGRVYLDKDNNCTYSAGDIPVQNQYVYCSGENIFGHTYTNEYGEYSFNVPDGVDYTITADPSNDDGEKYCPESYTGNMTPSYGNNFGYVCEENGYDLSVHASAWRFRPGFDGYISVHAKNKSCDAVNSTIQLKLSPEVNYVSATPPPSSVSGSVLTWDVSNFTSLVDFNASVTVHTPTSAQEGDVVCFMSIINPMSNDSDPSNNIHNVCVQVTNSWDPNDKTSTVNDFSTVKEDIRNTDKLYYRVRFQNTGTDTAYNIFVLDNIDPNLDLSTFEFLSASHPVQLSINKQRMVRFQFSDIMLPDDKTNEALSHGYIYYSIKPVKNLDEGAMMQNTAYIYFDFNEAVITNTTVNKIGSTAGISAIHAKEYAIWPNPANTTLNISVDNQAASSVRITDVLGKIILQHENEAGIGKIDVSSLQPGVYLISIASGNKEYTTKFVVNR